MLYAENKYLAQFPKLFCQASANLYYGFALTSSLGILVSPHYLPSCRFLQSRDIVKELAEVDKWRNFYC